MSKQLFVSYSSDDASVATVLRDGLEARGISCWMAPRDIAPGKDYAAQIINAIEECPILLLVLSASSNQSIFVVNEVERAVAKRKLVIPVRIEPVQPSPSLEFFISTRQWIEAWERPLPAYIDTLAHAIMENLAEKPVHRPLAPAAIEPATQRVANNLPHQLTPFIGREAELAALESLLAEPTARLITILGPGGMGKTRLSLAFAERLLTNAHFADGVYFLALASLSEVQHIVPTLMEVLYLSSQMSSGTPQQQLLDYLQFKEMMLLFDNFEHLLDGAEVVGQILQAAPQVRVLVTSRERLRLPGEQIFPLQGLDNKKAIHEEGAPASAAAQLFVQSARQLQPDLTLSDEDMAQVARICHLVGGMPLGIELSAAWSEVLSPAEIAAEIEQSFDFLEVERRGGQPHHRSIRVVFDSTWQRLDTAEQQAFARLSIFRGGFTREAAEQMAGASLRLLDRLAGKSLIQYDRSRTRYFVHELLRQFGGEKLLAIPQAREEAYDRHCTYYTTFIQGYESRLKGAKYIATANEAESEVENVRIAWRWAVDHARLKVIDRTMESLCLFLKIKGWREEGESLLDSAITVVAKLEPSDWHKLLLGKLLAQLGDMWYWLAGKSGEPSAFAKTELLFKQSIELLQVLEPVAELGDAYRGLSILASHRREYAQAQQRAQQAIALYERVNDDWRLAYACYQFGFRAMSAGNYQEATQFHQRSIALCEAIGDHQGLGHNFNLLGEAHKSLGELDEARQAAQRALAIRSKANDQNGTAWSLQLLGDIAWRMGELELAKELSEVSLTIFRDARGNQGTDFSLCNLGNIACSEREYQKAKQYFRAVLAPKLAAHVFESERIIEALNGMAVALAGEGKTLQAVELLTLVLHHPVGWQETRDRAARFLMQVQSALPSQPSLPPRPLEVVVAELLQD